MKKGTDASGLIMSWSQTWGGEDMESERRNDMNKIGIFMNFWVKDWGADQIAYIKKASGLGFESVEEPHRQSVRGGH